MDERTRKNRPGIYCRGSNAHALTIIWVIEYFAVYYSINYLASTLCNDVSIGFSIN